MKCSCDPGPNGDGGQTVVDHIRLFPLREDVRWTYRVHEQILPALRRANVPVKWTDITVRHTGYTDRELRERKLQRDGKILEEELAERPNDPFVLFNLGSIAVERQDWRACSRLSSPQPLRLGADRFDHAEAVCRDRPLPPDAGRSPRRPGGLLRRSLVRSRRRRVALPQGGGAPHGGPAGRGRDAPGGGS